MVKAPLLAMVLCSMMITDNRAGRRPHYVQPRQLHHYKDERHGDKTTPAMFWSPAKTTSR